VKEMINDPIVEVECNHCEDVLQISLTRTGRGWDDRNVEKEVKSAGWIWIDEDTQFCSKGCQETSNQWGKIERDIEKKFG